MKKKLLALGMMIAVTFSSINVAYANEAVSTIKTDKDGKLVAENINLDAFEGIAPGDSKVQKIEIKNEAAETYEFYILQETVSALEETNNAAGGAYEFDIKVGDDYENSKSLLSKKVGGYDTEGKASVEGLLEVDELDGYTFLTKLDKDQSTNLFLSLQVIGEGNDNHSTISSTVDGSNGLGYTNALGKLKLSFKVDTPTHRVEKKNKVITKVINKTKTKEKDKDKEKEKEKEKDKTITNYVKTGDSNRLFIFGGVLLIGVALLLVALKKNINSKKLMGLMLVFVASLAFVPEAEVKAANSVTLTFRAGMSGSFDSNVVNSIANDNVESTENYIKITVEKPESAELTVGDILIAGFGTNDIDGVFGRITSHKDVSLLSANNWNVNLDETVKHNKEYVLKYGVLVNPVMYTIRFVDVSSYDEATGTYTRDVAAPIINYGNVGDVIVVDSSLIGDYATTEKSFTLTLGNETQNIHTFYYAYTGEVEEEEVISYETKYKYLTNDQVDEIENADNTNNNQPTPNANIADNNQPVPNANVANNNQPVPDANVANNNQPAPNANIPDDDVPNAPDADENGNDMVNNNDNGEDIQNIPDEETPLVDSVDDGIKNIEESELPLSDKADGEYQMSITNIILISCISAIVVMIISATGFILYRKRSIKRQD